MSTIDTNAFVEFPAEGYKPKFLHDSQALKVLQVNIPAGGELPAHKSPEALLFVLEGSGRVEFPNESSALTPGIAVILPSGVDHAVKAVTDLRILVAVTAEAD